MNELFTYLKSKNAIVFEDYMTTDCVHFAFHTNRIFYVFFGKDNMYLVTNDFAPIVVNDFEHIYFLCKSILNTVNY